jgi:predicted ATP-dependent endonuclease of OLD family
VKLRNIIIEGFRGYADRVNIPVEDLTAIVGKNDAGKSSILEALEIFFNSSAVKMDADDACKAKNVDAKKVRIGCVFDDLPSELVLDSSCETTLAQEELLNTDGHLEIHKVFDCSVKTPKATTFVQARHRLRDDGTSLLRLNNTALKKELRDAELTVEDPKKNPLLRQALRDSLASTAADIELAMDEDNCAAIMKSLERHLPIFALFQSDRPSTDADGEVQGPVKLAIEEAIKQAEADLKKAEDQVTKQIKDVLNRTLEKLRDIAPGLANELHPRIETPSWKGAFKVKLDSDNGVPLNKRGSGVRRLILLSFFRAEAERRRSEKDAPSVIYGIEEPETSQHPNNQRLLMDAFRDLTEAGTAQVLFTTHVPGLAGTVPLASLRFVTTDENGSRRVQSTSEGEADDGLLRKVAASLGVIPDSRIKVLFFVEGPNDVEFFRNASHALAASDTQILDLSESPQVAFVPAGGGTLEQWIERRYLAELNRPEFHVYDGDYGTNERVMASIESVNARTDGSKAKVLRRRTAECYLHPDAIERVCGVKVEVKPDECTVNRTVGAMRDASTKITLADGKRVRAREKGAVKRLLNAEVAAQMTPEEWRAADSDSELQDTLRDLRRLVDSL